ncbi:hypothetical protein FGIG_09551 [Fasciola gigantica]|uniref:Uncharacterized protein n=1 Tax=Fasciola gigantica TaxID=46835 RepID=A0A504Y5X5_FASGI|nr:hypothetical protein FGIG_09551 [Fasciola gigantica]
MLLTAKHVIQTVEAIFSVHNGVSLKAPLLVPVGVRNDSKSALPKSHGFRSRSHQKEPNKSAIQPSLIDQVFTEIREDSVAHGPVLLEMRHGTPVYLPESLHLAFARYLARAGSPLIREIENAFRRYQFDRVYGEGDCVSPFGGDGRLALADKPEENEQAAFDIVTPKFSESSGTSGMTPQSCSVDLPVTRNIALPVLLNTAGPTRASPSQRRLVNLLCLEVRPHQLDTLRETILQCAPRIQAQIVRRVKEAVTQLQSVLNIFQKLGTSDRFHVSLTPGLVLPCHMYRGIVFQLVACVPVRVNKTKIRTTRVRGCGSGGGGARSESVRLNKSDQTTNDPAATRSTCRDIELTRDAPKSDATRKKNRRPSGSTSTITGLVLAQGGDYTHLVMKHCLPREYGALRLMPPIQPYPCHILLSWDSRETDSLQDLNCSPFRHLQAVSLRRANSSTPRSGPDNLVGTAQSSHQPLGDLVSPNPASMGANSGIPGTLGATCPTGGAASVLTSGVSHTSSSHSGLTGGSGTSGCIGGSSASALLESFVPCRDGLLLAYHLVQRMWSIGLPCELLTTPNVDMISAAEESGAEFAIRVNLLNPSSAACANLPTGTHCLSAVTYQLWTQHGTATRQVMVSEQRRADPDSLIAYLLHRISGPSELHGRRVSETDRSMMIGGTAFASLDWLRTPTDLVHYTRCFISSGAGVEPPGVVYLPRSSVCSIGTVRLYNKCAESPERTGGHPFSSGAPEVNVAATNTTQAVSTATPHTTSRLGYPGRRHRRQR